MFEELRDLAEKLKDYGVRLVVLFGSVVRGDYTEESDVDVLVVADRLPSDPRDAYEVVKRVVDARVQPTCFTTSSFLKKLRSESTFIMEVLEDGKVVYADAEFLEEVLAVYREVRARWVRRGRTWERGAHTAGAPAT